MSAHTLEGIADALAELIPERVFSVGHTTCRVQVADRTEYVLFDESETLRHLEYALREEIEARGWDWGVASLSIQRMHTAIVRTGPGKEPHEGDADTPAHALALALLAALKSEGGAQ